MKKYQIEYKLTNGDIQHNDFTGNNKQEAIRQYNRITTCPRSSIVSITEVK